MNDLFSILKMNRTGFFNFEKEFSKEGVGEPESNFLSISFHMFEGILVGKEWGSLRAIYYQFSF